MSTLADVARHAGVSKSTASRALSGNGAVNEETRKRVQESAKALGFVASSAAEHLATGRSKNIALLTPFVNRWFFSEVIDGVEAALIGAGYDLTLYRLTDDMEQRQALFDYFLVRKGVDAVIALSLFITPEEVDRLESLGKPIVGVGGRIPKVPSIFIDDRAVAKTHTEHLIALGHTRLMHIGGDQEHQLDFEVHGGRLRGFRDALNYAGIVVENDFLAAEISTAGGFEAGMKVLSQPDRPTAVSAISDEVAIGVMSAAYKLGLRVPEDVSVIGIDGHPAAAAYGLTTMVQHPARQGAIAVSAALAGLGGMAPDAGELEMELPVELKVRTSTGPAPKA
ncbi:MAG: LacI family DNA-binding transcriptional regulator [Aquiluna sp.]|jgi:DNA-binding LacI/PurR family transcriptional regulator